MTLLLDPTSERSDLGCMEKAAQRPSRDALLTLRRIVLGAIMLQMDLLTHLCQSPERLSYAAFCSHDPG